MQRVNSEVGVDGWTRGRADTVVGITNSPASLPSACKPKLKRGEGSRTSKSVKKTIVKENREIIENEIE